jgi:short-subunit dehydrogenase
VAERIARDNPAVTARVTVFDLEAIENLSELAEDVIKNGFPTFLVNNAGIALGGQFQQLTLEEFDWVLRVNFRAAVGLTHNLLPALLRSSGSHVVNVSTVYAACDAAGSVGVRSQ